MASEDLKAPPVSERSNRWLPDRDTAEHSPQSYRVFGRMGVVIIIEIDPGPLRAAGLDPVRPYRAVRPLNSRADTSAWGHAGGHKFHRPSG